MAPTPGKRPFLPLPVLVVAFPRPSRCPLDDEDDDDNDDD
jgi:hypothetical protein